MLEAWARLVTHALRFFLYLFYFVILYLSKKIKKKSLNPIESMSRIVGLTD
jgi:hypothetical protein